jgi:hypothetical protein
MPEKSQENCPGGMAPFAVSGRESVRRAPVMKLAAASFLSLLFLHAPAWADIWGFVDSDRLPHFAPNKLDERYELLLKDSEVVEPFQPTGIAARTANVPPEGSPAGDGEEASNPSGVTASTAVSPKLLAFFERSESYKAVNPLLLEASKTHGIDYSLLKALITAESGFNTYAVSPKGAVGLMQLIPPTAQRYGVVANKGGTIAKKLTDPKINVRAGARYLADLIKMFPGQLELAVAAYNAGEGAVQRAGNKVPNYPETQNYVKTVMQLYKGLARSALQASGGWVHAEPGAER